MIPPELLLRPGPSTILTLDAALGAWAHGDGEESPWARALGIAAQSSCTAFAFVVGYQAALATLLGTPPLAGSAPSELTVGRTFLSLAASEQEGAHPRSIHTTATRRGDEYVLSGDKKWSSLGDRVHALVVIAKDGERGGRPELGAYLVRRGERGVTIREAVAAPFIPEATHASIELRDVRVPLSARLPGDAYANVLVPFRSIEDACVMSAILAYSLATSARASVPSPLLEEGFALLSMFRPLLSSGLLPRESALVLAGALPLVTGWMQRAVSHWERTLPEAHNMFLRDAPLLSIAQNARARRTEKAWRDLGRD